MKHTGSTSRDSDSFFIVARLLLIMDFDGHFLVKEIAHIARSLDIYASCYYMALQSFDLECTWWRLFQKCVMRIKLDIYVFI